MNVIETGGLARRFGRFEAVRGLDLYVPAGSVFALVGPNGAGKTTAIKLLMNLLRPSGGSARVLGVDSRSLGVRQLQKIGYVSENQLLPEWMTAGQLWLSRATVGRRRWHELHPASPENRPSEVCLADRCLDGIDGCSDSPAGHGTAIGERPRILALLRDVSRPALDRPHAVRGRPRGSHRADSRGRRNDGILVDPADSPRCAGHGEVAARARVDRRGCRARGHRAHDR